MLASLTYTEMLAACLAAPFRASVFLDWFSLFKQVDSATQPIVHLLCFGEIANLDSEDIQRIKEQLEKSFDISSGEEALSVAKTSLELSGIQLRSLQEVSTHYEIPHQNLELAALKLAWLQWL